MRFEVASLITALTEGNGDSEDSLDANFSAPGCVEPGTYAGREERSGRIILHSVVGGMDRPADRGVCGILGKVGRLCRLNPVEIVETGNGTP